MSEMDDHGQSTDPAPARSEPQPLQAVQAEARLYDYFKHCTTLSLLTLGGLLASIGVGGRTPLPQIVPAIVIALLVAALVFAYAGMMALSELSSQNASQRRRLSRYRLIFTLAYGAAGGVVIGAIFIFRFFG